MYTSCNLIYSYQLTIKQNINGATADASTGSAQQADSQRMVMGAHAHHLTMVHSCQPAPADGHLLTCASSAANVHMLALAISINQSIEFYIRVPSLARLIG